MATIVPLLKALAREMNGSKKEEKDWSVQPSKSFDLALAPFQALFFAEDRPQIDWPMDLWGLNWVIRLLGRDTHPEDHSLAVVCSFIACEQKFHSLLI